MAEEPTTSDDQTASSTPPTLPAKVSSRDQIPEGLENFYSEVAKDGSSAYYLQVDTVPPAVNALNELRARTERKLEARDRELDELRTKLEEVASKPKSGPDKAKPSELADLEAAVKTAQKERDEALAKVTQFESAEAQRTHRKKVAAAIDGSKVALNPDGRELAIERAFRESRLDEDGNVVFISEDDGVRRGPAGEALSAREWLEQQTTDGGRSYWLEFAKRGSGSHDASPGGTATPDPGSMSAKEKSAFIAKHGTERWNRLVNETQRRSIEQTKTNAVDRAAV